MKTHEIETLLNEFLESIKEPVLVEGRKDRMALEAMGVSETIVEINRCQSLLQAVEILQENTMIILLTDLDQEGKKLRRRLLRLMGPYGMHENKRPREILAKMRVSHVEGLNSLATWWF